MTKVKGKIRLNRLVPIRIPNATLLKDFILRQSRKEGRPIVLVNYIFCDDDYLLKINQEFLKHDTYTDIITFDLSEDDHSIIAEIYISIERVRENAQNLGVSFSNELHRVMFHGILHLCGFGDKSPAKAKEMKTMENKWLKSYGFT